MKQLTGTYSIAIGNYDWGCAVDRAIIKLSEPVKSVRRECLRVEELKTVTDSEDPMHPLLQHVSTRSVTDLYLCRSDGSRLSGPEARSEYICAELYVSPVEGSPLAAMGPTQIFIWCSPYELHLCYKCPDDGLFFSISPVPAGKTTPADMFLQKSYVSSDGVAYKYAEFLPEKPARTLVVWLHGLGEGQKEGSDAYLPLVGHKCTVLAGEDFQKAVGGAAILVPQCPTYWMDGDGEQGNFANRLIEADGTSFYTKSLEELIDRYAESMQAEHIVLAGCSNGGYMCLVLALSRPDRYAAVVPICEAMPDKYLSDADIAVLSRVPLYFVYSEDDPVVLPQLHEIPTIRRLKAAGASELHVSVTEHVTDHTGHYKNADGSPYTYMGHLSWIYFDNNETDDGTGLNAWAWISERLK